MISEKIMLIGFAKSATMTAGICGFAVLNASIMYHLWWILANFTALQLAKRKTKAVMCLHWSYRDKYLGQGISGAMFLVPAVIYSLVKGIPVGLASFWAFIRHLWPVWLIFVLLMDLFLVIFVLGSTWLYCESDDAIPEEIRAFMAEEEK